MRQINKFKPWQLSQLSYPINIRLNMKYLGESKENKQDPQTKQNKTTHIYILEQFRILYLPSRDRSKNHYYPIHTGS